MTVGLSAFSAGHGLDSRVQGKFDPGATKGSMQEAIKTLGMAKRLYDDCRKLDMPAILIDDEYYANADDIAAKAALKYPGRHNLFLELHFDAGPASAHGVSVLLGKGQSLRMHRTAKYICRDLSKQLSTNNRGVHLRNDLAVTKKHNRLDSGLVELQFITNVAEMKEFEREVDAVELILLNRVRAHHGLKPIYTLPK